MEKLTNVIIDTDLEMLSFTVVSDKISDLGVFTVYVDECSNIDNIYLDGEDKHDYTFTAENSDIDISKDTVTIKSELIGEFDKHLKYIRLVAEEGNVEGVYYTPEIIYNTELTHIKKVCATCLDNKCMQLIMYITFKRQLLDSAIQANSNKEAMELYIDICRILEISTGLKKCEACKNNNACVTCANCYCTLK